ncbi:glycosyl transferase [Ascosphaera aggregata]|nr:glycosyl transferase [Ascosphaera aggregata]
MTAMDLYPSLTQCAIVSIAFKILLFPAYHRIASRRIIALIETKQLTLLNNLSKSTDFEVHRNWLAITHSLPPSEWYLENTSEWTLDYPPFFAWFEYALSWIASFIFGHDTPMLQISNLNYSGWDIVWFQRGTVIATELLLLFALKVYVSSTTATIQHRMRAHTIALSILLSPALLIIDHIHFQYNGFLSALFILSLTFARRQSTLWLSGLTFSVLLCFKHIYLYVALAYFVYLGRAYCLDPKSRALIPRIRFANIIKLGVTVIDVFALAFGPFVYWDEIMQVKERLFPFARGLCHAYWAPNFWALYALLDKVLIRAVPQQRQRQQQQHQQQQQQQLQQHCPAEPEA